MSKLYLFNPDSDLALANNDENYMAPAPARKIGKDLALLPIWYCQAGSMVLAQSHPHAAYFNQLSTHFEFSTALITYSELACIKPASVELWGWNLAVRKQLIEQGISEDVLYTSKQLSQMRELSHRKTSALLLNQLAIHPLLCGLSETLYTISDLDCWSRQSTEFILKAPLSGSGKGLKWARYGLDSVTRRWFINLLDKQGSVMVEPIYNKVKDFAMEFQLHSPTEIEFIGFSSFTTNQNGAYTGNNLIADTVFENQLEQDYFYSGFLSEIRLLIEKQILRIYGKDYRGYLGVDMMVCRSSEKPYYQLHPCVEVNLRMNMGIVAHSIHKRYVAKNCEGIYRIDYAKKSGKSYQNHLLLQEKHPLIIKEGKIQSGYLALCPVTPESQYHAWILIA